MIGSGVTGICVLDLRKKLKEQRADPKFCDAILRVNGETIGAHRCVLAATSQYFHTMFYGVFRDKQEPEVDLTDIFSSSDILKAVLDYIYGDQITVTEDNVSEILGGADFLMLPDLKALCLEFLLGNLTLQNSLWTWTLAYLYSLDGLNNICEKLAIARFHDHLVDTKDVLVCPPLQMHIFFKKGLAMHCSVPKIKLFIQRYVNYDPEKRSEYRDELQQCAIRSREQRRVAKKSQSNARHTETVDTNMNVTDKQVTAHQTGMGDVSKANDATECLILQQSKTSSGANQSQSEFFLYSIIHNKWYKLFVTKLKNINLVSMGIGGDKNVGLFIDSGSKKLFVMNIVTKKRRGIRRVPTRDLGAPPHSTHVRKTEPFVSVSQLYCLSERVQNADGTAFENCEPLSLLRYYRDKTRLRCSTSKEKIISLFLHRFDFEKAKWQRVCLLEESETSSLSLHVLHHEDEKIYIFLVKKTLVNLYQFNGLTKKVKVLEPLELAKEYRIEEVNVFVSGSHSTLTLSSVFSTINIHGPFEATYNIDSDCWTMDLKSEGYSFLRPVAKLHSHTRNEGYVVTNGELDSFVNFSAINLSDRTETRLATIPGLTPMSNLSVCRVSYQLLNRLKSPEVKLDISKPVCSSMSSYEIRSLLHDYKKTNNVPGIEGIRSPGLTISDCDMSRSFDYYSESSDDMDYFGNDISDDVVLW